MFEMYHTNPATLTTSFSDRENCTVFVADLPADAQESDIKTLFKDVRASGVALRLRKSI